MAGFLKLLLPRVGRLTNPPHPLWEHFESFHILQQPTYMSMYPPAQGLILAAGIAVADSPWAGVYLANAVACGILCWMLQGWLPPRWALLGALPRLLRHPRVRDSLALGAGVVILANCRPYEGLVTVIGAALVLLVALGRSKPDVVRGLLWEGLPAAAAVVLLGAAATLFYHSRVTGSPFRMPYLLNKDTYGVQGLFVWQKPRPAPLYRHEEFRRFYVQFEPAFQQGGERRSLTQHVSRLSQQAQMLNAFYCGPLLLLPFLAGILGFGSRRLRPLVCIDVIFLAGMLLQNWVQPHYVAPIYGLLLVVFVHGIRRIRTYRFAGRPAGLFFARAVPSICGLMLAVRCVAGPLGLLSPVAFPLTWAQPSPSFPERARLIEELSLTGEKHLVIVHYGSGYDFLFHEWVYNEPNIDGAQVVFAREMDGPHNERLIQYFKDRRIWRLSVDGSGVSGFRSLL